MHALGFGLAAAIGEKDEGDAVGLEIGKGAVSAGEGFGGAEEDAVDAGDMLAGSRDSGFWNFYSNANAKLGNLGGSLVTEVCRK